MEPHGLGADAAPGRALFVRAPAVDAGGSGRRVLLGPLAEALRAGGRPWAVRRIGDADDVIDGVALARAAEQVGGGELACCVVVGAAVPAADGLRLALRADDAAVEGGWALARLADVGHRARSALLIAIVDRRADVDAASVLASLGSAGLRIAVTAVDGGAAAIDTLVLALRGAARDPRTGVITARSLAAFVAGAGLDAAVGLPAGALADAELLEPPALEQRRRLGWSLAGPAAGAPPATSAELPLGTVLPGRVRLDARLAEGSFGLVYRARQLAIGRDVAVKVLRPGIDPSSEDGQLFAEEIQAVGRIDHPNVVRVYHADVTADGRLFFAMELLAGRDLQARVDDGPLATDEAVGLVRQLLAGLDAAHRAGLVHADVKPGNAVVVDGEGGARVVLVDFGLARLRRADDGGEESVGGTPAFMAPEQLTHGRVDARSDLFAAALVLVALLTGWRRTSGRELAPPPSVLESIDDARVRAALVRALAIDPAERFAGAAALSAALAGEAAATPAVPPRPPFHGLAAFAEDDRGLLFGRDRELTTLSELALHRRAIVITAPSGVGKTSLLRAGLAPRLAALSTAVACASCRTDDEATVARTVSAGAASLAAALAARAPTGAVVLVDQVEAALEAEASSPAAGLLAAALQAAARRDLAGCVALSVREDFLARLLDRAGGRLDGVPIVRVGPLDRDGARDAIVRPLAARRLAMAPDLLERLLDDLEASGRRLGTELGWGVAAPVYPPHLQLACSVLHERLPAGEATITLAHYRALGGFEAIVGEHLDRVLDGLAPAEGAAARALFIALVTSSHGRSARTEAELADALGEERARLPAVLEHLRRQGLVVRVGRPDGEPVWELIHDSLVPRVLGWLDRRDLARRRAIELVRYHLRRSQPGAPSLLSRVELREVAAHRAAVAELDAEWRRAHEAEAPRALTPAQLVERSRRVHRRTTVAAVALVATVIGGVGAAINERRRAQAAQATEARRRELDLGLVAFELAPFDWDPGRLAAAPVAVAALPELRWTLATVVVDPDTEATDPGAPFAASRLRVRSSSPQPDGTRLDTAEASGGPAFLVLTGRHRAGEPDCGPAYIPIRALPGYAQRDRGPVRHRVAVPTCQVTRADLVDVPAGPFLFGGVGDPPSPLLVSDPEYARELELSLERFSLARTETTNAEFRLFSSMASLTGVKHPIYFEGAVGSTHAADDARPVTFVDWNTSRRFCQFLGRDLPSSEQWHKALRGPAMIDGRANRRTFAWTGPWRDGAARIRTPDPGAAVPCTHPLDVSLYRACDLVGNVSEWTSSSIARADGRVVRGASWDTEASTTEGTVADYVAIQNPRPAGTRDYALGFRCALAPAR